MIPPHELLPVWRIVRLWVEELRGTDREVHDPDLLEEWICTAFFAGKLRIRGPEANRVRLLGPDLALLGGESKFPFMKVERAEFLRWLKTEGYPRPMFWGAEKVAKVAKAAKVEVAKVEVAKLFNAWLDARFKSGTYPSDKALATEAKKEFGEVKGISARTIRRRRQQFGR